MESINKEWLLQLKIPLQLGRSRQFDQIAYRVFSGTISWHRKLEITDDRQCVRVSSTTIEAVIRARTESGVCDGFRFEFHMVLKRGFAAQYSIRKTMAHIAILAQGMVTREV